MRLIDSDALIADLEHDVKLDENMLANDDLDLVGREEIVQFDKDCKENAIDLLRRAPAIDAVEVVRCKDCKHHRYEGDIPYCINVDYGYGWNDDDFCSKGERREE